MATCNAHPTVEATETCDSCKAPICSQCTRGTLEGLMCPACARKAHTRRSAMTWVKIGAVAAIVTGVAITGLVLATRGNRKTIENENAMIAKNKQREAELAAEAANPPEKRLLDGLRERLAKAPCDQDAMYDLAKELTNQDHYEELVETSKTHLAKCADFPRLKWKVVYALQQLGRYADAIPYETQLIADDWRDSDFWWWRGEDKARSGDPVGALADYRQSIANSDDKGGSGFAVGRILDPARAADRDCEGVAALDYYVTVHAGTLASDYQREANDLDTSADCAAKRGTGSFKIPDEPTATIKVAIGGVTGTFALDPTCGTTAISSAFAARAQLAATGAPVDTVAQGAVRSGASATVDLVIGKAKAPATEVVVLDGLTKVDGVVGLSAIWKFELTVDGSGTYVAKGAAD